MALDLRAAAQLTAAWLARNPQGLVPAPTLADIIIVPQLFNARRFAVDLQAFPRILEVEAACSDLPAFKAARPDAQPDADQVAPPAGNS